MRQDRTTTDAQDPRAEALRILRRVDGEGAYAGVLLEQAERRIAEPRDAALLHEIVLGSLRQRAALDHALRGCASRPPEVMDADVLTALRIGAYALLYLDRVPDFAAVDTAVGLVRARRGPAAAAFANAVLREIGRRGAAARPPDPARGDVEGLALRYSHPAWWVRRLVDRRGWDRSQALLEADNRPAPTTLRVNRFRGTVEELRRDLAAEGVAADPGAIDPDALRVRGGGFASTRAFREGRFHVQDEASQLAGALLGAGPMRRVADVCAAPGGKTMAAVERLADGGLVLALDRHPGRLRRLVANASRLGHRGVAAVVADATRPLPLLGEFDGVIVDAPCSGTGTLRRHPEIRWRLVEEDLVRLAERQRRILATAAQVVGPRGVLVYSVCSLEPEEGEEVLRAFLESHPAFEIDDPRPWLPPAAARYVGGDGSLRTDPAGDGLDGFFAVRLVRGGCDTMARRSRTEHGDRS